MILAVKKAACGQLPPFTLRAERAPGHIPRSGCSAPGFVPNGFVRLLFTAAAFSLQMICGRCIPIASSNSKELEINERIRDKEIRLIGADGAQMGIMSSRDALRMAYDQDLDLVKVAPQAKPPVCKILD